MVFGESCSIISKRLEQRVYAGLNSFYNVIAFVESGRSGEDDSIFGQNKSRLLDYCKTNEIHIHSSLGNLPAIYARMTGRQILELSNQNYILNMDLGDQPDLRGA